MGRRLRFGALSGFLACAVFAIHVNGQIGSQSAEIALRLGRMLFEQGQYPDALDAYKTALAAEDTGSMRQARAGVIGSALRVAEFDLARKEADILVKAAPRDPDAVSLYGDALWSAGLFDQAADKYREALAI